MQKVGGSTERWDGLEGAALSCCAFIYIQFQQNEVVSAIDAATVPRVYPWYTDIDTAFMINNHRSSTSDVQNW